MTPQSLSVTQASQIRHPLTTALPSQLNPQAEDLNEDDDNDCIDFEELFDDYYLGPPYKFKQNIIDNCYIQSNSRQNLAVQLV